MTAVYIHVVLVTVVALAMLLGPPSIGVLLGTLGRFAIPTLWRLTFLDLLILITVSFDTFSPFSSQSEDKLQR